MGLLGVRHSYRDGRCERSDRLSDRGDGSASGRGQAGSGKRAASRMSVGRQREVARPPVSRSMTGVALPSPSRSLRVRAHRGPVATISQRRWAASRMTSGPARSIVPSPWRVNSCRCGSRVAPCASTTARTVSNGIQNASRSRPERAAIDASTVSATAPLVGPGSGYAAACGSRRLRVSTTLA